MRSLTWVIDRKVWTGGVAGILTALLVYLASRLGYAVPLEVIAVLPVVINSAIAYLVPQAVRDVVSRVDNSIVRLATADPLNPTTAIVVPHAVSQSPQARAAAVRAGEVAVATSPTALGERP